MCVCVVIIVSCICVYVFLDICMSYIYIYLWVYLDVCMHIYIYIYIYANPSSWVQGAETKLGILLYHKQFYYKTRLIFILKNKRQNKKIDAKQ